MVSQDVLESSIKPFELFAPNHVLVKKLKSNVKNDDPSPFIFQDIPLVSNNILAKCCHHHQCHENVQSRLGEFFNAWGCPPDDKVRPGRGELPKYIRRHICSLSLPLYPKVSFSLVRFWLQCSSQVQPHFRIKFHTNFIASVMKIR